MKVSKLIKDLQELLELHGDKDVFENEFCTPITGALYDEFDGNIFVTLMGDD